jgi:hypothetical protein
MTKYEPLRLWLDTGSASDEVTLGFADIEKILSAGLPASAHRHQAWWANDPSHVQAAAWLSAGWRVDGLDAGRSRVRFRRGAL